MWTIVVILILVGLLMLLLEILVIPGAGVAGIVGFALMVAGIWLTYSRIGTQEGHITLAVTMGINLLVVVLALRSKTWKKAMLSTAIDSKASSIEPSERLSVGDKGQTISRCAPMGKAIFDDQFFEVSSFSDFIDEEKDIEIVKISGKKIFVKQINS